MSIPLQRATEIVAEIVNARVLSEHAVDAAPGQVLDVATGGEGRLMCELLLEAVIAGWDERSAAPDENT